VALNIYSEFISCLYMFTAHVLIVRRSKLCYAASDIITHKWPSGAQVERELQSSSQPVHGTATYMCDDTTDCIAHFWPPNDKHVCSKLVEA